MGTATSAKPTDQSSTDTLIQSVMQDQKRVSSREVLPELEPADPMYDDVAQSGVSAPPTRKTAKAKRAVKARIAGYRPTLKHIAIAGFVLVMVLRPWLIPGILFVTFWVGLIAWLTVGPDRMMEIISNGWDRLSARNPAMAERMRQRGDAFALRFDAMLDRLPDSWAEKLALPDMSKPVHADKDLDNAPDPFEKLKLPEVYRG
ncbi:MAG: hypothetical protein AB8B82_04085 [Roseovarius sp.]